MSDNFTTRPVPEDRLVFAIRFHESLEVILMPYLVQVNSTGEFLYSSKQLNFQTLTDHFNDCSEAEIMVVKLLDECRDELLMKVFSKKAKTVAEFYKEQTEERLKSLVIPYVQKRTDKALRILMQAETPLYFKGRKNDPVLSIPIQICRENAKAVFNFARYDSESHYFLSINHSGKDIPLKHTDSLVLVNNPGWVLTGGNIYLLEKGIEGTKLKPFFSKDHIVIPSSSEEKYFSSFVSNVLKNYEVRITGMMCKLIAPPCKPVLKLEKDLGNSPVLMLYFTYAGKKCLWKDKNSCWVEFSSDKKDYGFVKIARNSSSEEGFIRVLTELALVSDNNAVFRLPRPGIPDGSTSAQNPAPLYSMVEWLSKYSGKLESAGFILEQGFYRKNFFTGTINLEMDVAENNDWFDVHATAVFGKFRIPFLKLKSYLLGNIREYVLPDGNLVILPEEWFSNYNDLLKFGKNSGESIRLGRHHFMIAKKMTGKSDVSDGLQKLHQKDKLPVPEVPSELEGVLRPYQLAGFAWIYLLYRNHFGGCLADDMGLGKTLQTLALLWKLKKEYFPDPGTAPVIRKKALQLDLFAGLDSSRGMKIRTTLIVMPLSLIHNWENEIRKFTPGLSCIKYTGMSREAISDNLTNYDIVLTTYGVVRNDMELLMRFEFFYLILDESQIIKNPRSKISRAVRLLKAENRLVLTGTPVENTLTDLWSQLTFLNPGLLGSQQFFQDEFVNPVEKFNDEHKKNDLKRLIEPFILRRTKSVVEKDLPELSEKIYYCEMSEPQKKLYESKKSEIRNGIYEKMNSPEKSSIKIDVLRGLMQLRLISNHPELAGENCNDSGKFEEVTRNIGNLIAEGHKVLIFSQFVKHLRLYRDYFNLQNWKYAYLTGELNDSRRKEVIAGFQGDPDNLLFLISLRAGGVGLNLTAADYVFILDPWWNPAVEQQAISRAHRIGQKKNVFSYKFISKDSVEEKILRLQHKKSELAGSFINVNNPLKLFTDDDLLGLFV